MDHEGGREAAQELQPDAVAKPSVGAHPGPVGLLRGTSNAALAGWLARSPAAAPAETSTAADREAMEALEKRMNAVKEAASERGTTLGELSDKCLDDLKDAKSHLKKSNENYKEAYGIFKGKLDEADERFEMEQAIVDSVQGVLVAAALAVIGPEMLVVGGAIKGLEAAAAKHAGKLVSHGFKAGAKAVEGAAGELAEQGAGAGVGGAKGKAVKPGSTAAGAGATPGDKYEEAFGKLDVMVDAMPKLGKPTTVAKDVAVAAGDVATEAVRLAGGRTGKWTATEATEKGQAVSDINAGSAGDLLTARLAANQVLALKNAIVNIEIKPVEDIERMLWTNWMASLEGDKNEVLDNDVIQDYLEGKGMISPGDYMSDADQAAAVKQARRDYLKARGIDASGGAQVDSLYRREMKLDELKRRLLGKHGRISGIDKVNVEGKVYDCPGMMGGQVGDEVVVSFIMVKPHLNNPGINIAHWGDRDFEVMGNTLESIQNAGKG